MFTILSDINWFSVLLAFLAYFFLGGLWFTALFKKAYLTSLGKHMESNTNTKPIFIIGPAICSLIITITTAILFYSLDISSIKDAFIFSMLIGNGYLVTNTVNIAINPNIPRPLFYGFISGTYHLVGISIVCSILMLMR